jgi:hypothetical protein
LTVQIHTEIQTFASELIAVLDEELSDRWWPEWCNMLCASRPDEGWLADVKRLRAIKKEDALRPDTEVSPNAAEVSRRDPAVATITRGATGGAMTASPGEWAKLSEASDRLYIEAIATAAPDIIVGPVATTESTETRLIVQAFRDIISYGEVHVRAVRSDCGRLTPERVETLLAAARHTSFLTSINEIDAYFDSRQDRAIFGPRSSWTDIEAYPPSASELHIRFFDVQVHSPSLVKALAAAGFSFKDAAAEGAAARIEPDGSQRAEAFAATGDADPKESRAETASDRIRPATEEQIRGAITAVYNQAKILRNKPPNIRQLPGPVQEELRRTGRRASGNQIMKIGEEKEFADCRWPIGKTVANEKRKADFTVDFTVDFQLSRAVKSVKSGRQE